MFGSRASRTTSGSISKNVQVSPSLPMAGQAAGAEPDHRDIVRACPARARAAAIAFGDRPAEIVIGQRLGPAADRRAVGLAHALGAMDGGAVIPAAGACRSTVSTTRCTPKKLRVGLDQLQTRLPQAGDDEGQRPRAPRSAPDRAAAAASGRPARPARSAAAARPAAAAGSRRRHRACAAQQRRPRAPARCARGIARTLPASAPGSASSAADDQDRILVGAVEQMRREQAGEDAAEHAAERGPQIELGQQRGRRPPA